MMSYRGGDLLLTGAVWPTVGLLPRPVCAGCEQWPSWPAAPFSDESALEVAWPPAWLPAFGVHDDALYKSTAFTFICPLTRETLQQCFSTFSVKRNHLQQFCLLTEPMSFGRGWLLRPRGPKFDAERQERGEQGSLGERCKLPQRGSGQSPDSNTFWTKSLQNASSGHKCRTQIIYFTEHCGPAEPLDTTGGTLGYAEPQLKNTALQSTAIKLSG